MEIRVVDFDVLTQNYSRYQDGIKNMNEIRQAFVKRMDPIRQEMEAIVKSANSGLITDERTQQEKIARFGELQDQAMGIDNEFKTTMREEQDRLNKATYDELSSLITGWSEGKGIDMIMGKMEVVFAQPSVDITESILELLKEKGEFVEFVEEPAPAAEERKNIVVEDLR